MTTLTTTGNASPLLALELSALGLTSAQINELVQQVTNSVTAIGTALESGTITREPDSTANQLKFNLDDPNATGLVTINGGGFNGTSGSINRIQFAPTDTEQLGWSAGAKGKWNADSTNINSVSSIELFNADRTTVYKLNGPFKLAADDGNGGDGETVSGNIRSMSVTADGYTLDMKGRVDVNDLTGRIERLVIADGSGDRLEARGRIDAADLFGTDVTATTISDYFDNAALWSGNDKMTVTSNARAWNGFAGNDVMTGGTADDTLTGGEGRDRIDGRGGDDLLSGGVGADVLIGGAGADSFLLNTLETGSADTIRDFRTGDGDRIVLDTAIFTGLTDGVAGTLVVGRAATAADANDFLLFDTAKGRLYYDADGNGSGEAVQIATLTGVKVLTEADLQII